MDFSSNQWVLLHHQVGERLGDRGDHYDFLLSSVDFGAAGSPPASPVQGKSGSENSGLKDFPLLLTWAIPRNPLGESLPMECSAERLPDHRRAYLEYEGPISGDRGRVQQVARGSYEVVNWSGEQIELRLECVNEMETRHEGPFLISLSQQRGKCWGLSWSASH